MSPDTIISSPSSLLSVGTHTVLQAQATKGPLPTSSHTAVHPSMSVSSVPSFPLFCLTTAQSVTPPPPPVPLIFVGQSNNYSSPLHLQLSSRLPHLSPSFVPPPNVNPFYLKFIMGNIRMCQGCKSTLCTADGRILPAPYDLTIAIELSIVAFKIHLEVLSFPTRKQRPTIIAI